MRLARADAFITSFKNDPLITPAVAPHAIYTLDGPTLRAARELSRRHNVPTLIHLAESNDETKVAQERRAPSPVAYLEGLGFLGPGVLAAHGVWVSDADIQVLRMRGVGVSHNPESNMKTASGVAPVPAYLRAGVAVGLGTDGAASNNDLDMFEAMRVAALLHKHETTDPSTLSARTVLEMATIRGARALGMETRIGSLEPKKRADLITVVGVRGPADADVRSDFPPRLRDPWRRCPEYDRERPRADARPEGADARRGRRHRRSAIVGEKGARRGEAALATTSLTTAR